MNKKRKHFSKKERQIIYNKCFGHCAYCGKDITYNEMQVDHVISLRRGGTDDMDNLMPSCRSCNHYKHTLSINEFRKNLEKMPKVLMKNSVTYQIALRYNMIIQNIHDVKFYFEGDMKP